MMKNANLAAQTFAMGCFAVTVLAASGSAESMASESNGEAALYAATMQDSNGRPCPPQGGADGDGGLKNSDPIDLATGGYQLRQTDLMIPGRGLDFEIKRTYRSYGGLQARIEGQDDPLDDKNPDPSSIVGNRDLINGIAETPLGQHWDFNYNMRISYAPPEFDRDGYVVPANPDPVIDPPEYLIDQFDVMTGDGRIELFQRYEPDGEVYASSTPANFSNEHYRWRIDYTHGDEPVYLTDPQLTRYEFFSGYTYTHTIANSWATPRPYAGRLKSITDRNGNVVALTWETSSTGVERIDYITDSLGNEIDFIYHSEQFDGQTSPQVAAGIALDKREQLIWAIEDEFGRAFEYNYDFTFSQRPVLISVTTPSIESTSDFPLPQEHERFSGGRTWTFEYDNDVDLGPWFEGRMLTKVTSPNGDVVTENEYEYLNNGLGYFDRNDDRVMRQKYGDGYYCYIVTTTSGSPNLPFGPDAWEDDYYVWVNDRNGAITRFKYAGTDSTEGFHRQLLERTVYEGFVPQAYRDKRVWGVQDGASVDWYWLDVTEDALDNDTPSVLSEGLRNSDNTPASGSYTWSWETNENWEVTAQTYPNGDSHQYERVHSPSGTGPGSVTDSPLRWGAIEKSTITDGVESITEEWRYDFTPSGAGGGCGCGSVDFATAHKDGNGNVTLKHFDAVTGDLLAIYHDMPSSAFNGAIPPANPSAAAAIEEFEYNAHGQVITHIHPESIILDDQGNEVTHRRVDRYEYYDNQGTDGVNYGRLHRMVVDATPDSPSANISYKNLATEYEYDAAGNVVKETSPSGDITEYVYNQSSQLVRVQHFDSTGTALFSQTDYFYDANGNVVREELANLDSNLNPDATNASITSVFEYDIHDFITVVSREAGVFTGTIAEDGTQARRAEAPIATSGFVTERYTYDNAKNLVMHEFGEAVAGGQPDNLVSYEYDSRDLLIKETRGIAYSGSELVADYELDARGRVVGKHINDTSSTDDQHTAIVYDVFSRAREIMDPMGNEVFLEYDDNHNLLSIELCGPVGDDAGAGANVRLAKIVRAYDARDRVTGDSTEIFGYQYPSQSDVACNSTASVPVQLTKYLYNDDSSLHQVERQTGDGVWDDITTLYPDSAGRAEFVVDALGNTTFNEYDADSNLVEVMQTDYSGAAPLVAQIFSISYGYDALNRQVTRTDGVGNLTSYAYDSRSNLVGMADARGNVTTHMYDALSRRVQTSRELTDTGDDSGTVIDTIIETSTYDDSSRLVGETDDNGNTTTYDYDGLSRLVKVTMPDDAFYSVTYDKSGNPVSYTDARGVVVTQDFDRNNRLVSRSINDSAVAGGIPGASSETFTYDGLGRLRTAVNDFAKVTREYDSRSNVVREIQNADAASGFAGAFDRVVEYAFDSANNNEQITYPSGRHVFRTHDELNRLAGIFNAYDSVSDIHSDPLTEFEYVGRRVENRNHGNGTRTGYSYNGYSGASVEPGDKGFGRVTAITTSDVSASTILDAFTFTWDESQNRTSYKDTGSGMDNRRERTFGYDSIDRLVSTDVDFPDPNTSHTAPTSSGVTTYTLDGVHNRTAVGGFEELGAPIGTYSQSGDQALNNQYTRTPRPAGGAWDYTYDANGNLLIKSQHSVADYNSDYTHDFFDMAQFLTDYSNADPDADINGDGQLNYADVSAFSSAYGPLDGTSLEHWHYGYDYRNQLVEISHRQGTTTLAETFNTYDALARRVEESIDLNADSTPDAAKQLVYGGVSSWEVLEQIDLLNDETSFTHVFGIGIDDEVSYRIEDLQTPEDYWSHRDDLNTLTSITDGSGAVVERYEYGDYGDARVFDASGTELAVSVYLPQHLYTGRMVIGGTGLLDYRFRVLETGTGRFVQRDPLGHVDTMNLYIYAMANPAVWTDPLGLSADHGDWDTRNQHTEDLEMGVDRYRENVPGMFTPNPMQEDPYSWVIPMDNHGYIKIDIASKDDSGTLLIIPYSYERERPGTFRWFDFVEDQKGPGGLAGYACSSTKRFYGDCSKDCGNYSQLGNYDYTVTLPGVIRSGGIGRYWCDTSQAESLLDHSKHCTPAYR